MAQAQERKQPKKGKSTAGRHVKRVLSAIGKCLLTIFLIGTITVTIVGCVLVVYAITNFDSNSDSLDLEQITSKATSSVYTLNDQGEEELFLRLEGTNRIWTDLKDIPLYVQRAVIAIEDERFESHYGVDWKRTIAAFVNLFNPNKSREFGGSTITQQVIKNVTGNDEHSIERKISEIFQAAELEKRYSKDDILQAYLNILPLSSNIEGVGAGAQYYFGKDIRNVTLAEAAVLASITQNPSKYNPYTHPENLRQRQQVVLAKMYELGFITEDEYRQALGEELHFQNGMKHAAVLDYYTDLLIEDVIADLMDRYGYTRRYAQNMVFYGGLKIVSAEKPAQQQAVEAIYANEANFGKEKESDKGEPAQGAIFIMDYDGRVVATVGGRGEKTGDRVLNRSTQSMRQPGSSIKPLTAYSPALKLNLIHYSSLVHDAPLTLPDGKKWPPNYGARPRDNGMKLLNYAIQKSLNTIPARLVQEMTPQVSFDFASGSLKLSTLVKSRQTEQGIVSDIDLAPMALGGLTDGVYARDMAAAYCIFGNGGYYNKPYTYYTVSQGSGNQEEVLLTSNPMHVQVLDTNTTYVMNRLLQEVVVSGTASDIGRQWKGWEVYGKTGTTDNNYDVYFAGGTPYYCGASWYGYDKNKDLVGQTTYARSLWNKAMKALHNGLKATPFTQKGTTQELQYCTQTGMIATASCPKKATGVYKPDNIPGACTTHGGGGAPTGTTTGGGSSTSTATG